MTNPDRKKEWSVVLFCLGVLILSPPILSLYDIPVFILGLPLAYVFLFGVWGLLIVAMAMGARPASPPADEDTNNNDKAGG